MIFIAAFPCSDVKFGMPYFVRIPPETVIAGGLDREHLPGGGVHSDMFIVLGPFPDKESARGAVVMTLYPLEFKMFACDRICVVRRDDHVVGVRCHLEENIPDDIPRITHECHDDDARSRIGKK
mgnify:CR=1 FL=1